jgi:hypothetical protein
VTPKVSQIDWAMGHQKSKNTREVQATSTLSLACDGHMSEYPTIRPGDHRKIGSKDNFRGRPTAHNATARIVGILDGRLHTLTFDLL